MEDWEKNEYRLVEGLSNMLLIVENEGQNIKSSNYWDSSMCERGLIYMTGNAGALRLLVPPALEQLATIQSVSEAIVSRGLWSDSIAHKTDAIEILLEDHTDTPFAFHFGLEQCDLLPPKTQRGLVFSAWASGPRKLLELPCSYRIVPKLPWLKPWNEEV